MLIKLNMLPSISMLIASIFALHLNLATASAPSMQTIWNKVEASNIVEKYKEI